MKKQILILLLLSLVCSCKEQKPTSSDTVLNTASPSDSVLLIKLTDIKSEAQLLWSRYLTTDSVRKMSVAKMLTMVSFSGIDSLTFRQNGEQVLKTHFLDADFATSLQLMVGTPEHIKQVMKGFAFSEDVVMVFHRANAYIKDVPNPQNKRSSIIYGNVEKIGSYNVRSLALCLIHECNHIFQYLYLPDMSREKREQEAWHIELGVFESNMSEQQRQIFVAQKHAQEKKLLDSDRFYEQNKEWLYRTFGQTNHYIDLFAMAVYGFESIREKYDVLEK